MADIYFYQVQFYLVLKTIKDDTHYDLIPLINGRVTKSLQQCDPEDESDGNSTLVGETNTQV